MNLFVYAGNEEIVKVLDCSVKTQVEILASLVANGIEFDSVHMDDADPADISDNDKVTDKVSEQDRIMGILANNP